MEKKDKNNPLRLVINYYGLNNIIILIYYPIPLISKLQNRLVKIKYFIKINLKLGFYFVRIAEKKKIKNRLPLPIWPFRIPGNTYGSY